MLRIIFIYLQCLLVFLIARNVFLHAWDTQRDKLLVNMSLNTIFIRIAYLTVYLHDPFSRLAHSAIGRVEPHMFMPCYNHGTLNVTSFWSTVSSTSDLAMLRACVVVELYIIFVPLSVRCSRLPDMSCYMLGTIKFHSRVTSNSTDYNGFVWSFCLDQRICLFAVSTETGLVSIHNCRSTANYQHETKEGMTRA